MNRNGIPEWSRAARIAGVGNRPEIVQSSSRRAFDARAIPRRREHARRDAAFRMLRRTLSALSSGC